MAKSRPRPGASARKRQIEDIKRRKSSLSSRISTNVRYRLNLSIRQAARDVMNELAEKGPRYTGEFIDKWRALAISSAATPAPDGEYPYQTKNIPQLSLNIKEVRRVTVFAILNEADYALEALDLEPSDEFLGLGGPIGGVEFGVLYGKRYGRMRGEVTASTDAEEDTFNVSTAERDWYTTYVRTGIDPVFRRSFMLNFV